jgi:hypothetical protein
MTLRGPNLGIGRWIGFMNGTVDRKSAGAACQGHQAVRHPSISYCSLAVFILSCYVSYSLLSHTCLVSHSPIDPQSYLPTCLSHLAYLAIVL